MIPIPIYKISVGTTSIIRLSYKYKIMGDTTEAMNQHSVTCCGGCAGMQEPRIVSR